MHWLDLFNQSNITIHYVPRKSNVVADALLHCPDLAAIVGSLESSLLAQFIRLRQLLVSTVLCSMMVCYATHEVGMKSFW